MAAAALRRRPPAEVLAADPAAQLQFVREAMEESNEAECGPAIPLPVVVDVDADGVPCRLYARTVGAPVFVYLHGGGWCYGSIETADRFCRRIADRSGCAVLSVGYRLAPEHVFPAALDDVETVLAFVRKEGADLGVDPSRLAIGGDSAGGAAGHRRGPAPAGRGRPARLPGADLSGDRPDDGLASPTPSSASTAWTGRR